MTVFSADDRSSTWRCAKILLANEWTIGIRGAVFGERIISIVKVHNVHLAAETFHCAIFASVIETCCYHQRSRDTRFWIENERLLANVDHIYISSFF